MNNQEFTIGQMINNEEFRVKICNFLDPDSFHDPDLVVLAKELKNSEFSFSNILKKYGIELTLRSMEISKNSLKIELKNKGKL
jgi:hypothetical protein